MNFNRSDCFTHSRLSSRNQSTPSPEKDWGEAVETLRSASNDHVVWQKKNLYQQSIFHDQQQPIP